MTIATMIYGTLTLLAAFLLAVMASSDRFVVIDWACWMVGVVWDRREYQLCIRLLPMVGIVFEFKRNGRNK